MARPQCAPLISVVPPSLCPVRLSFLRPRASRPRSLPPPPTHPSCAHTGLRRLPQGRLALSKSHPVVGKVFKRKHPPFRFTAGARGHGHAPGAINGGEWTGSVGGCGVRLGCGDGVLVGGVDRRSLISNSELMSVLPMPTVKHVQV